MPFTSVLLLLSLLNGMHSFPQMLRHLSESEFAKVSRDAFKKLEAERWKKMDLAGRSSHDVRQLLNSAKLKELLGVDVGSNPQYMSEVMPSRAWQNLDNELEHSREFEIFKQQSERRVFAGTPFSKKRIGENNTKFEDVDLWIRNLTLCTVETFWKDFGANVWPRYINVGRCSNKPTCSFPSGMKCHPSRTKTIKLLYWVCPKHTKSPAIEKHCFWSSFQTEIIRACHCSC